MFCIFLQKSFIDEHVFVSRAGVQTDSSTINNHDATTDDDAMLQQRRTGNLQHAARGFAVELLYSMSAATTNRRSQHTRSQHTRPQAQRPSSENVLPDLVTSCATPYDQPVDKDSAGKTVEATARPPPSHRPSSRSAVRPSIRFTVKLCPRCYHDRRKSSLLLQCTACRILEEKTDRSPPDNDDVSLFFLSLLLLFLLAIFSLVIKRYYFC